MTATPRGASPADLEPPPPVGARIGVMVAAASGVCALFSTALAQAPYAAGSAVVCALVVAATAWAPVSWASPAGLAARRVFAFSLLAITLVICLVNLVSMNPADVADFAAAFGVFLGRLLISVLPAQLVVTDKMRELRVALLLTVGMFVLAVANEPGTLVAVMLLVGWPAVVTTLAYDHGAREQAKANTVARVAPTARRPRAASDWSRVGGFTAVSALVAVLFVLVVPHPLGIRSQQDGGFASGNGDPSTGAGGPPRTSAGYTSGSLDMRARGTLPNTPVADIPINSPELWRGAALDYYDGTTWRAPADATYGQQVAGGPHFDLPVSALTVGTGLQRRDVVHSRPALVGVLLAPGQPTAVEVTGRVLMLSGGFFLGHSPGQVFPETYTVSSTTTEQPQAALVTTPVAALAGEAVPTNAVQLPDTLPPRVRQLAQRITAGTANRDQATRAVETYVRGHATYRLDSPVPPAGEDAVDDFLFVAHTGFCEQFAAAEVVLLRSVGVPARLATGFAGGEPSGDQRTLLGSDAHAWVEVWYPGVGWAASDPTAGTQRAEPGVRARVSAWLHSVTGRLIIAGAVLVATLLGVLLVWWFRRRASRAAARRRAARTARRPLSPVLAAFDRLQRALADVGSPRAPAESVGELAQRPALREAVAALAVVERTSYGALAPVGPEADDAVRTLDGLAVRLRGELEASER